MVTATEQEMENKLSTFKVELWKSIEVVITGRTRNALTGKLVRGFESHLFRQNLRTEENLNQIFATMKNLKTELSTNLTI